MNKRELTSDTATLKGATGNLTNEMLKALADENEGIMRSGQMPQLHAASASGQKQLMSGLCGTSTQKAAQPKVPPPAKASEDAVPKTSLELAVDLMGEVLAESTSARKKSMALGAVKYAGELATQLLEHAEKLEAHYKVLQTATAAAVSDEAWYEKCFKKIAKDRKWFETAQAGWCGKAKTLEEPFPSITPKPMNIHELHIIQSLSKLASIYSISKHLNLLQIK